MMLVQDEQTTEPHQEEPSPWSRPGVIVSGMFLLLLMLGGIAYVIFHNPTSRHRDIVARPGHTTPTTTASTTNSGGGAGGCTLPAGSQQIPTTAPPSGTQWATVGSMQVPQAPSVYGPQRTSGVFNICFAHNPTGALLAAMNLWGEQTTTATPAAVFQRLAIGAPKNLGNTENLNTAAGGSVQLAGYRYISYTPGKAVISIVLQGPQQKLLAVVMDMMWRGHDWRFLYPSGGVPSFAVLPDLAGYVPWSSF